MAPRRQARAAAGSAAGVAGLLAMALVAAALVIVATVAAGCDGLIGSAPDPVPEADGGAAPKADDDTTPYDPAPSTPPTPDDGSNSAPPPEPDSVTVNVGINRGIVADYPGDACGSVASLLVIDAVAPGGTSLGHQELDCRRGGYNGFTWYDRAPGTYVATVQLFEVDSYGTRAAVTPPRVVRGDLVAGQGAVLWADFTYRDIDTAFTGNLKWQVGWVSAAQPDVEQSCGDALPAVAQQRITVRDDAGAVVDGWARGPDGFVRTDGSAPGACSSFATSDALVVTGLRWGVYTVTVEGLDTAGQVAYCERRPLFAPIGDGVIFHLVATAGACPAEEM
ncbi:MAG: hypothetical protein HY906_05420 [Deltaproteobacteria bacterium]|nr:hypothetical protein [Deltaproteobacteria bacterium]